MLGVGSVLGIIAVVALVAGGQGRSSVREAAAGSEGGDRGTTGGVDAPGGTAPTPQDTSSGISIPDDVATQSARLDDLDQNRDPAPVSLRINTLNVRAPVSPVGVAADGSGELAVPGRPDGVVWYRFGPSPGAEGSAVLAGHVDYGGERGVFFRLGELTAGDQVSVAYDDGSRRRFRVVERNQYAKADLPSGDLFAREGAPVLSLITCGGAFDRSARSYRDNVVVRAVPTAS